MAAELHLPAFKRVPFKDSIDILGPDFSGAAFALHIRNHPGDTGSPLVSLTTATAGTQGVSATYDAAYVYDDEGSTAPATVILVQIDEATLEALALNNPTSGPLELSYDLHITPSGGVKFVAAYGKFTIYPGVTI